ncbi:hypothetical protein P5G51_004150 [Virgibacillus sp. 179-BFC.A HS]|uniref:Tetratricopeptide repeat protein n=1 Tax=Tigheibacillus jepli TaxID=3035914 RepID=A0ABU5CED5_9BACI|nr:hypothetical protein [Virgibacillus sp. 179-BFC.A HS]MDY0404700.1 hypothetical protein [Virgibacillus sp. 179-BFC.A HS]
MNWYGGKFCSNDYTQVIKESDRGNKTPHYYLKKANNLWKTGNKQEAGKILGNGLKRYPKHLKIREQYADYAGKLVKVALKKQDWQTAIDRLSVLCRGKIHHAKT